MEAAITVPVFLLLLIGIIQFTLLWHGRNTAEAAAAEAANTARTYLGSAAAGQQAGQAFLQQVAPNLLKDATITVTRSATEVTVTITARVSSVVPFGQFSITETASAPVERFTPSP